MGEILGLGVTHFPPYAWPDEHMADALSMILRSPVVDAKLKDPKNWPDEMRREWSDDSGRAAAVAHRERMRRGFEGIRSRLDDFAPDFVVVVGDDQYENFREDIIPPFCLLGLDQTFELRPWSSEVGSRRPNVWGEPAEFGYPIAGFREGARHLARGLLERGVDMAYGYRLLHEESLGHAFANTILFLDPERRGFPYPLVPLTVNSYGSDVLRSRGGMAHLLAPEDCGPADVPDPPAPAPWRCMEVGARLAATLEASPWRVALIASASWSHAFLSPRTGYVWPDVEADRRMIEALERGEYETWRTQSLEDLERSGQHELLNWMLVVGAMEELGHTAVVLDYIETYVFNSNKAFVTWSP